MEHPTAFGPGSAGSVSITPTDPYLSDAERARLTPQCWAVLQSLRRGPAWNYELATIGLSYTRRLSDLRAHGYQVDIIQTGENGARLYGLIQTIDGEDFLVSSHPVPGCDLRRIDPGDNRRLPWLSQPMAADGCLAGGRVDG